MRRVARLMWRALVASVASLSLHTEEGRLAWAVRLARRGRRRETDQANTQMETRRPRHTTLW